MNYQEFKPHPFLESIVKFYWTLQVPYDPENQKQKIIPDGCIEMTFNLGDKIKRYTSENEFVIHPDAMVMGQRTRSFFIEPAGDVDTIAVCFYPHGFANFVKVSLEELVDREIPLEDLFDKTIANELEQDIVHAPNTQKRIEIIESFLSNHLHKESTIDQIVKTTIDTLLATNGNIQINDIVKGDSSQRRQLERAFKKQIGIGPKQLGKVIRLQAALQMMLHKGSETLSEIAYENEYFDQTHFIKDFKEFVGITPKEFSANENMALAALFYK